MTSAAPRREPPAWLLDELASAGRENLDETHVSQYDTKEDADAVTEVALCERLGLAEDSTVVELGAGTGQFTLAVAPVCRRVVAVDVSPVMLRLLEQKVGAAGFGNVEIVQAGFLTYEHRGEPADFVYSRFALHHIPDAWKAIALARIHQVLRPGGIFRLWDVVYNFGPGEAEQRLEAWCSTLDGATDADGWTRADIEEHVRDEHSTFTWLLEPMAQRAGFAVEEAEYSPDGVFAKYVLRRR